MVQPLNPTIYLQIQPSISYDNHLYNIIANQYFFFLLFYHRLLNLEIMIKKELDL